MRISQQTKKKLLLGHGLLNLEEEPEPLPLKKISMRSFIAEDESGYVRESFALGFDLRPVLLPSVLPFEGDGSQKLTPSRDML